MVKYSALPEAAWIAIFRRLLKHMSSSKLIGEVLISLGRE